MADKRKLCPEADPVLGKFLEDLDVETSHHRMIKQEKKCSFGLSGVCCRLCANGPCRISEANPRGVCGADADTIVARNFLRSVAAGSGCYIHVVENAARQLKKVAQKRAPLAGTAALDRLCRMLGISGFSDWDKAEGAADVILCDLRKPVDERMELVEKLVCPARIPVWEKAGILPGGAKDEVFNAVVKTSTNLSSDPADMLHQCLRLGISTGVYGLVLTNLINDILMGEAEIGYAAAGLGVMDPDCVNIMITGHQHALFGDLQEFLSSEKAEKMAEREGAKAIRIVGCTCVGQDFQLRQAAGTSAFCGHAGNNYTSEAILASGCIDLVLSEFNCTLPGIEPICRDLGIPQICLDDVAKKANAEYMPYSYEERRAISQAVAEKAASAYRKRKRSTPEEVQKIFARLSDVMQQAAGNSTEARALESALAQVAAEQDWGTRKNPLAGHGYGDVLTGVTEVTLKKFLGGSFEPLIDLIKQGKIKGIAGVVGCSNLRAGGHDVLTVELVKKLIQKNILVLSAGCTSGGLENCGLMSPAAASLAGADLREVCQSLGIPPVLNFGPCLAIGRMEMVAAEIASALDVDIPQLPIVISAPQWLEEQALADGAFALALGFTLHLGLAPFVTGSSLAMEVFTSKMENITGGRLMVDPDGDSAADALEAVILEKRSRLGL